MDFEQFFHECIKAPLNNLLTELSRSNIDLLSSGNQEKTNETVKKILDSSYFQNSLEDRRASYDCHARFKCSINEGPELKISSTYPLCFAPIPNENYFYCRGNLTEATKSLYDEIIPSRDYSSHSYEWKYLFSVEHAVEALGLVKNKLSEYKKHRFTCLDS